MFKIIKETTGHFASTYDGFLELESITVMTSSHLALTPG